MRLKSLDLGYALPESTITFLSEFMPEELALRVGNSRVKIFVNLTDVKILFSLEFKMAIRRDIRRFYDVKYNKLLITEQFF